MAPASRHRGNRTVSVRGDSVSTDSTLGGGPGIELVLRFWVRVRECMTLYSEVRIMVRVRVGGIASRLTTTHSHSDGRI